MEKLVRDKIALEPREGQRFRQATPAEMPKLLLAKVREELSELEKELQNDLNPAGVLAELADVYEALSALVKTRGLHLYQVAAYGYDKADRKGGFEGRYVLLANDPPKNPNEHVFFAKPEAPASFLKVGGYAKIIPESPFAKQMVKRYGEVCRIGKIGATNVMFVNEECEDADADQDHFTWGFWLSPSEATVEHVEKNRQERTV